MRTKTGLDYFPLDVDWLSDDKLTIVQADYGNRGIGVVIRLLGEIYRNGYFIPWTVRDQKRFALRAGEPVGDVVAIVDALIAEGFFDQRLAGGESPVLTSVGIQKRWKLAVSRRTNSAIPNAINLLTTEAVEAPEPQVIKVTKRVILSTNQPEIYAECQHDVSSMSTFTTQSKVKESKVKKIPPLTPPSGGAVLELVFPPTLDTPEHREAWKNYVDHRRRIRRPYRSIESQNAQLKRWANRPDAFIAAIANAIANEWTGLHQPSTERQNPIAGISAREQRALDVIKMFKDEEAQNS